MSEPLDEVLLRPKQIELMLGLSRHTIRRLRLADPTFPRALRLTPGIVLYRRRDIRAWLRRKELEAVERAPIARRAPDRAD